MDNTDTAPRGLTIPDAAARAGVTQTAIREAISQGRIPTATRQVLVVHPDDVDTWTRTRQATS